MRLPPSAACCGRGNRRVARAVRRRLSWPSAARERTPGAVGPRDPRQRTRGGGGAPQRGVEPAPQPVEGHVDVTGASAAPSGLAQNGSIQPRPSLPLPGGHVIADRHAASCAARLASRGREGTERRTCFVSRPVSRPVAGGLEIPTATAIARPGGVSRGRAPRALASAMPPLTPRPPLSSPLLPAPAPPPRGSLWPHLFCVLYQRSPKNKMSRKIRPLLLCKTVYGQTIVINERTAPGRHGSQRILF